jgi:hypothetical protein
MSIAYRPEKYINFEELFDGRLERLGVHEKIVEAVTSTTRRFLVDGLNNRVWVIGGRTVDLISVYEADDGGSVLAAISEAFDTPLYVVHEPQFWGHETAVEMLTSRSKTNAEYEAEFFIELRKYLRGASHNLEYPSIEYRKAMIAEDVIADFPELEPLHAIKELSEFLHEICVDIGR